MKHLKLYEDFSDWDDEDEEDDIIDITSDKVANEYSRIVKSLLTPEQLSDAIRINKDSPNNRHVNCATFRYHNYMDTIKTAFNNVVGKMPNLSIDFDVEVILNALNLAKVNNFKEIHE